MEKKIVRVALIAVATIIVLVAAYWVSHAGAVRAQATKHPFTATILDQEFHGPPGSPPTLTLYWTYAVRSDGSWSKFRRVQAPDGTWANVGKFTDFSTKRRVFVDGMTKSVSIRPFGDVTLGRLIAATKACTTASQDAKTTTYLGYSAVETSMNSATPLRDGLLFKSDSLKATDLDCFELEGTRTWTKSDGTVEGRHIVKALTVAEGEPSPALFAIPAGYTQRSLGDILRTFALKYHKPDHPETDALMDRLSGAQ